MEYISQLHNLAATNSHYALPEEPSSDSESEPVNPLNISLTNILCARASESKFGQDIIGRLPEKGQYAARKAGDIVKFFLHFIETLALCLASPLIIIIEAFISASKNTSMREPMAQLGNMIEAHLRMIADNFRTMITPRNGGDGDGGGDGPKYLTTIESIPLPDTNSTPGDKNGLNLKFELVNMGGSSN
ncbi:MAG: hypothetical protein S4CHLAM20_01700 [Chlamydiia bacterium]|nr:hypothetical protein [Chlamydiia bacterium]